MLGLGAYGSSGSDSDEDLEFQQATESTDPNVNKESEPVRIHILNDHDEISSEPETSCDSELEERFQNYFHLRNTTGYSFIKQLHENKEFGNPGLLDVKIKQLHIKENGTNFPPSKWDPVRTVELGGKMLNVEVFVPTAARKQLEEIQHSDVSENNLSKTENLPTLDPDAAAELARVKAKLTSSLLEKELKRANEPITASHSDSHGDRERRTKKSKRDSRWG